MSHLPLKTNLLSQPLTLPNGVVIPNRLAKAATSETLATYSNNPTKAYTFISTLGVFRDWNDYHG